MVTCPGHFSGMIHGLAMNTAPKGSSGASPDESLFGQMNHFRSSRRRLPMEVDPEQVVIVSGPLAL
ncbi:hypothetical protein P7K49_021281 [Saguinus oedipus]|uniref:Uncharacterized protein n=1 Tax=Saguinus oedipus TaxID=9490 RepID=A0ABQ9US83_SAGOE|nr:hypothetical protein P7K49_021281 [Saguinus oedipus]